MADTKSLGSWEGGLASFLMILASEMGDKTFLIEAILSSKGPRLAVFTGTMIVMTFMTVLGAYVGVTFVNYVDPYYINIAAALVFISFAVVALFEALRTPEEDEVSSGLLKEGASWKQTFWRALSLVFLAEWGDRSQIGTVALAARTSIWPVIVGAVLGHVVCSATAVIAGRLLSEYISERLMSAVACVLFTVFAVLILVLN
jgi:putative Ca2+/H+ antiporter (TMEM165/GDT1 family)